MDDAHHIEKVDPLSYLVQRSAAWIGVGGAIVAVLSFCILVGMWFGPLKNIPTQLDDVLVRLSDLKGRVSKIEWDSQQLETKSATMTAQLIEGAVDRSKIKDDLRKVETTATQLAASTVSRETFIEWKAALENRNKSISAPPLSSR